MKHTKLWSVIVSGALSAVLLPSYANALSTADMDYTGDNIVNAFDLVAAGQSGASVTELQRLQDFLLCRPSQQSADGYTLKWSDEFSGDSLDMNNWSYELGNWKLDANGNYVTNGWGNNEQEFYTDRNASVNNGVLTIAARHENWSDPVQGN